MEENILIMAESLSAEEVAAGLAKARLKQKRPEDFDGNCTCGEEIPPARVGLGYYNCVVCQGKKENRRLRPR